MVKAKGPLNSFCVDLEEWFHICGVSTPYDDPSTWDDARSLVERDVETLMRLLDDTNSKGTFLTVGWVAEKYPAMIRRLVDAGHEIGCHSYYHRLIYSLSPETFNEDIGRCVKVLREISGQPVTSFRAPGFSMKRECFWAYPILRSHGITVDVSIVPAQRDHGGVDGFTRDAFRLETETGDLTVMPVSVMQIAGRTIPFSGGGYLRLFPLPLIRRGYDQNHRDGRPGMSYIHPREINSDQPRLKLPWKKYFKYYVGIDSALEKLRRVLEAYPFTTIAEVVASLGELEEYELKDGEIRRREAAKKVSGTFSRG
jgi:polysaccharide deacetylase family protein (PEP-CTERM system associated)